MNVEIKNKAVEILTSIQATVSQAKNFTLAQLPDIASQYITYSIVYNVTYSSILLLVIIAGLFILFKARSFKDYDLKFFTFLIGVPTIIFLCNLFITGLQETIMVIFAPKVWLILELAKIIK